MNTGRPRVADLPAWLHAWRAPLSVRPMIIAVEVLLVREAYPLDVGFRHPEEGSTRGHSLHIIAQNSLRATLTAQRTESISVKISAHHVGRHSELRRLGAIDRARDRLCVWILSLRSMGAGPHLHAQFGHENLSLHDI